MFIINFIFSVLLITRFYSLSISIKNEKNLLQRGATQYGATNSKILSAAHIAFYLSAIIEANVHQIGFDATAQIGLIIILFALLMLLVVIRQLKEIWTVKIYLLPDHQLNRSWLFKYVRHPNYFLNILPELIGLALFCHAQYTALIGLPIYAVILAIRIKQEEQAMRHLFSQKL